MRSDQAIEDLWINVDGVCQSKGEIGEQHGGIVEGAVEAQPREGPWIPLGPLREQGGLAVTGGRHDSDHVHLRGPAEPIDQRVSLNDAGTRNARRGRAHGSAAEGEVCADSTLSFIVDRR